jgi:hypothetical protein
VRSCRSRSSSPAVGFRNSRRRRLRNGAGRFAIGRHNEVTGCIDVIATFASADVAVAQIFESGRLTHVIGGSPEL